MAKSVWVRVMDELETCVSIMAVWVILKGEKVAGRVIARYSKGGSTTFVIFQLFGWATLDGNGDKVCGYKRMTGYGYDRTRAGIGEILSENRERLKSDYGIELDTQGWNIQNTWQESIKAAGFNIIQAI